MFNYDLSLGKQPYNKQYIVFLEVLLFSYILIY